jgi:amino acid adenylation domain-containing protein
MTLFNLLEAQAREKPLAPSLLAPGREALTRQGLLDQLARTQRSLSTLGVLPSMRIAVVLANGPEAATATLAAAATAVCAPLNPALHKAEFRAQLESLGVQCVLVRRAESGPIVEAAAELGLPLLEIEVDPAEPAGCFRLAHAPIAQDVASTLARPVTPLGIALLLQTSGTTAKPKLVPLSEANLLASARSIAAHLRLTDADCCLNVMPLFHIHGLVGALLASIAGGSRIVCTAGFDSAHFFQDVAQFSPTWTTAVPTIHQAMLAQGHLYRQCAPQHRFRFVRSSSAALPAATLRRLEALFDAPVVEAYGMTEASHQMASNPIEQGAQLPGSVGQACGTQIAILDPNGGTLAVGQEGEIVVRGPGVTTGYLDHAEANAQAFHGDWFRTGDLGRLDAAGRLFITGRLKELINRGGEKIAPREVDEALLEHAEVAQAVAFGIPHASLGEDLAAAVVRRSGSKISEVELRRFLFERLAAFKVPSQIVFLSSLPTAATGKVQRIGLHQRLVDTLARDFEPAANATEVALESLFREVLQCAALGRRDNFFAIGGDSLAGARVVARVNRDWGLALPLIALFRHPCIAELAAAIEAATTTLPAADPTGAAGPPACTAAAARSHASLADRAAPISAPCSFSQEALWVVETLLGASGVYNVAQAVRIVGALNASALERALNALVQRHAVLRTRFVDIDGTPHQYIETYITVALDRFDGRAARGADAATALHARLRDEALRPFDLGRAPLVRASLWTTGEHEQVLLIVAHHIAADGWSVQVIANELSALYGFAASPPNSGESAPALPPLVLQFAGWARWQREPARRAAMATSLDHWRQRLAGLEPLDLPTDQVRPAQLSHAGQTLRFQVPEALAAPLRASAQAEGATLFMLLLTAFKVLLLRYTRQEHIAVGSPVAGRHTPELEGLIGYFVNSVVLRTDLAGNPTFAEALQRVRRTVLDALTHQDLPFDQLVAELSPQRDLSRNPLYQVSFALNNQPEPRFEFGSTLATPIALDLGVAKFDLSLAFVERAGALHGSLEYSTDLFQPATMVRLVEHLQNLLAAVAADPQQAIESLALIGTEERARLLLGWNDTARAITNEATAPTRFEEQVRRTPHAQALWCQGKSLSYTELNVRSNRLAHALRHMGIAAEVPVVVCMDRSPLLLVALLAVLKAGGAIVPLDPELPAERLAFILGDTLAPVLLTQSRCVDRIAPSATAPVHTIVCLDTPGCAGSNGPDNDLGEAPAADQLACIIYTSGSTGQPKGVMLEHAGWTNHTQWLQGQLQCGEADRFVQITSIGFDAALVELFMPLQCGASLVLAAPGQQRDMAALARLLADQRITILQMVPSALRALLAEPLFGVSALRELICGGEALDLSLARELQRRLPGVRLGNFYGPTETTIDATHSDWPPGESTVDASLTRTDTGPELSASVVVAIGKPIANAQCYVLDRHLQPVPTGVIGELFIGGAGLARGYLRREALTAQAFVAHPFEPGRRLYRSGDLARWRSDGQIEFRGRVDSQVKLRGYRIELGEIEACLAALAGVRAAAALVREDSPGLKRLVAYACGSALDAAALKRALATTLPDYMVPSQVVVLADMPKLPSGKINRRALTGLETLAPDTPRVAPRNPREKAVWDIWHELLKTRTFGVHDNFFDLGGHSLLATQVLSRLRSRLGVEVSLRDLFAHPTLEGLANSLAGATSSRAELAAARPIVALEHNRALPLSYSQQRMWLVQQLDPNSTAYNMTLALRLEGALDTPLLVRAIDTVVSRHEVFRTRFELRNGKPVQCIGETVRTEVSTLDLSHLAAPRRFAAVQQLRDELAGQPFDLTHAGLHRLALLQLADHDHVLLWVMHHAIGDQWSNGILVREVGEVYSQLLLGSTPTLPRLPFAYVDFAAWQREAAQDAELEPQLNYWLERLRGLQALALPYDFTAHGLPSGKGSSVSTHLPASTFEALHRLSTQHGATSFMTLLAAFQWLLARHCGQSDIAVGSPVANRNRLEFEPLVGPMINTLVVRNQVEPDLRFVDLLERVKETALQAFAHPDAPFERVVELLGADRAGARSPLVQVLFNVIHAPSDSGRWVGAKLSSFEHATTAAQFDLSLMISPSPSGEVRLAYSTDVFAPASAQRLLDAYVSLLDQVVAAPNRRLRDHDVVTAAQRAELATWNDTARDFGLPARLDVCLADSLARHGHRTAVRSDTGVLSYAELASRSRRLARCLRARGVARGSLVGLCVERSIDMLVAQLAILQAGAAYVPLDPAYPPKRLAAMVREARLAMLVTESSLPSELTSALQALLPATAARERHPELPAESPQAPSASSSTTARAGPDACCLILDQDAAHIASFSDAALASDAALDARPDDPAYVIFTSGSTGRPKGVEVPHRAVVNFLASMIREPGLGEADVLVALTTLSFDIAVLELLTPLMVGGQIVLARREDALDGRRLRALLESSNATVLQATPTSWRLLVDAGWLGGPRFKALIGGEPLPVDLARQLLPRCGELWNLYGPTETTVWSTRWRVNDLSRGISIGRPIANTQVHVLDANGLSCPIGTEGELCIGGAGVALGYLNQPELTRARFIQDPWRPGARLYRTGDRGRWRHDGWLEHLGRIDQQIKLRGHRIEPGDIEAALASHPAVAQAMVVLREDRPGDTRLVAYVVARPEAPASEALGKMLRERLRASLPEYMLPQHIVAMPALPLQPNGKIDRQALPAPTGDSSSPGSARPGAAPGTPLEREIAAVWQELLGVSSVDPQDNFFDLGGHSLLAVRAIHEIEKRIGLTLSLRRLVFESLAQLSNAGPRSNRLARRGEAYRDSQAGDLNEAATTVPGKLARWVRSLVEPTRR